VGIRREKVVPHVRRLAEEAKTLPQPFLLLYINHVHNNTVPQLQVYDVNTVFDINITFNIKYTPSLHRTVLSAKPATRTRDDNYSSALG
jgi:hypothetical protein